jgi:hypothetical protein
MQYIYFLIGSPDSKSQDLPPHPPKNEKKAASS